MDKLGDKLMERVIPVVKSKRALIKLFKFQLRGWRIIWQDRALTSHTIELAPLADPLQS